MGRAAAHKHRSALISWRDPAGQGPDLHSVIRGCAVNEATCRHRSPIAFAELPREFPGSAREPRVGLAPPAHRHQGFGAGESAIARSQWPAGSRVARIATASLARVSARAGRSVDRHTAASFKSVAATCGWVAPSDWRCMSRASASSRSASSNWPWAARTSPSRPGSGRDLGMRRWQDATPLVEGGQSEGLRLGDAAPSQLDPGEVVHGPRHRRVHLTERCPPHLERGAEQRLGLVEPPPVFEQRGQVVHLHGVIGMARAQSPLGAGQRQPVEGLGSGQVRRRRAATTPGC